MTAILFLSFVALMAGVVVWLASRYLDRHSALVVSIALVGWLVYVGVIGHSGILRNPTMRPPGMIFLLVPVVIFLVTFAFRAFLSTKQHVGAAIPLVLLLGIQSFRIIVELFIHQLWWDGVVPGMLTYSGANVDIYIGATAPIAAWLSSRWKWSRGIVIAWNFLGLLALANVVVRAILSAPGPLNFIHAEVPNRMFGTFPFMFIPGFFVPLAVVLHLVALKVAIGTKITPVPGDR